MDIEKIYQININNIRIFLFFIEFLDTKYTCDYFSITRQYLSNIVKDIEKKFKINIFDSNRNFIEEHDFIYIKNFLYKYLISIYNSFNSGILDIDIGYNEILPYKIIIDFYKNINKKLNNKENYISFVKFNEEELIKLVYLNEISFGFIDNYPKNKYLKDLDIIELKKLQSYWNLYSRNNKYNKYIQYKNQDINNLYSNKNVLIKTNNINFCLKMIEYYDFLSYLPENKYLDFENQSNILLIEKTNILSKKYFIYNKNIIKNDIQKEIYNIVIRDFYE